MKVIRITFAAAFALSLAIMCAVAASSAKTLEDNILRIHVRANGNSEEEQRIKLAVKDKLVEAADVLFADCENLEQTKLVARENTEYLKSVADGELKLLGADYTATVKVKSEFFPTKYYDNIALPAGKYDALVVELGSGEGENWWCMLYPSLCPLNGKNQSAEAQLSDLIGYENYEMISGVTFKFKLVELWGNIRSIIFGKG